MGFQPGGVKRGARVTLVPLLSFRSPMPAFSTSTAACASCWRSLRRWLRFTCLLHATSCGIAHVAEHDDPRAPVTPRGAGGDLALNRLRGGSSVVHCHS